MQAQAPAPEKGSGRYFNVTRDYDPRNPSHHSTRKEIDEHFNGTPGWIRSYHADIPPEHQLTLSKGDIVKITGIPPEGGHYNLPEGFIWFDSKSGKYITNPADQKIGVFWSFHGKKDHVHALASAKQRLNWAKGIKDPHLHLSPSPSLPISISPHLRFRHLLFSLL